jgi:hypothetical protein
MSPVIRGNGMKINLAHLRHQGISFAVFDADARSRTDRDRDELLAQLADLARANGLRVDKAALAFTEHGRLTFYGTSDLVRYLSKHPLGLRWTHKIDV